MIEKIPGVGGEYNKRNHSCFQPNNLNLKKRIGYENSKNTISNNILNTVGGSNEAVLNRSSKTNIQSKKSNFNRKRNFAEVRQIKRGFRHLLQSSDSKKFSKRKKSRNNKINTKQFKEGAIITKNQRKQSISSLNSWDSIEERLNLLEKNINYNYYVNSEEVHSDETKSGEHEHYFQGENFLLKIDLEEDDMRRGHQHHPRFVGQRKSNVDIEDVLSALNKHDVVSSSTTVAIDEGSATPGKKNHITSESSSNSSSFYMDTILDEHSLSANTTKQLDLNKNLGQLTTSLSSNNNIIAISNQPSIDIDLLSADNTKSSKNKSKISHKKKTSRTEKSSSDIKGKREKRNKNVGHPEGSQIFGILDDDLEAEELAKLRCTSERTEVVAERENRRNKNRCADYPGLSGLSIFSSDTMMKFNIIRNELHNIMKSQLKRVMLKILTFDKF